MESVTAGWENFFVAEAGGAAALSGLLFVAVSINLTRILQFDHLPGRAAETLAVMLSVLGVATLGLVPRLSPGALGAGLVVLWLVVWSVISAIQWRARKSRDPQVRLRFRVATNQLPTLPILIAGVSLLAGWRGSLYWLVPGTLLSFASGVLNAWVLLVEIQR